MSTEIQNLLDRYAEWIRDNTSVREIDEWTEITTPYLDRHNDYIQIYAKNDNDHLILTDDGETIEDLRMSGCSLDGKNRQQLLNMTLNGLGIRLEDDALIVRSSKANFASQKHNLIQAILSVNDLFYLAAPTVASLFLEDVTSWLDEQDIRYTPNIKLTGESGYDHLFDFVIPKSRFRPERIIKTVNYPNGNAAKAIAFSWIDTSRVRPDDSEAFVFLNDTERTVSGDVVEALSQYRLKPIFWSRRELAVEELAA